MKTDRELLELAANAIGTHFVDGESWDEGAGWNPLDNDGDALRLAVALRICLDIDDIDVTARIPFRDADPREFLESDQFAATRRAIVRAAAEIGATK